MTVGAFASPGLVTVVPIASGNSAAHRESFEYCNFQAPFASNIQKAITLT